jgi:hypothetical protein
MRSVHQHVDPYESEKQFPLLFQLDSARFSDRSTRRSPCWIC